MKFFLAIIFFASATNCFSQSSIQYKDTINNFSIKIPKGWRYVPGKGNSDLSLVAIRTAADSTDKPHENYNVNILDKKNSSFEREYGKLVNYLSSTGDFNLVKNGDIVIHNQPYKWFIETHQNTFIKVQMTNYVFVTYRNEKTYILTFVSYTKDFDKYEGLYSEIANSFSF